MEIERSIERVLTTQVKLRHLLMFKTVAERGAVSRAAEELTALRQGAAGKLAIGSYMVALPSLLPRALSIFFGSGDATRISVVDGSKEKLLSGLQAGEIDLVVGRMSEQEGHGQIRQIPLYFEPIVLVAGRQNPLAGKPAPTPADLAAQEWIMPHASSVARAPIQMFFAREGLDFPSRVVETLS